MPKCAISTKIIPATCAWMLLLGCTGLFFAFTCRYLMFEYSIGIAIYQSILTIYVISNFGLSTFMDPGIYPKASNELVKDGDMPAPLHKSLDINNVTVRLKWCNTCKFYRPPRSTHCGVCDCCIEVFDHHCPWVNNCVGRRNYRYFFQFLISLTLHMFSIFALCLVFVLDHREDLRTKENIISLCIMAVIGLLCIPVVGLTCFHVVLISRGRTTNEQVTGKMRGTSNPYNLGCAKNCCYLFCGPTWPRMLNRTPSSSKMVNNINNSMATYIASENKVKIYMEEPNGVQRGGNKDYNKMTPGNYQLSAQEYEYLNTPSSNNSANYFEQPCARLIEGSGENGALLPSANYGQASGISHLPPRPNTLKMSTGTPLASDMKYPTSQALQPHALQVPVDRSRCSSGNSPTRISVIPPKTFPVISHPIVVPRDPSVLQGLTIRHTKESGYTSEGASRPLLTMEELNNGPLRRFSGSNRASVRPPPPAHSAAIASGMQNVYDRSSLLYGTNQHYVVRQDSDITEYKV